MTTSRQHVMDIDKLSACSREELEMLPPLSSECCIYRVPERMRKSNEHHYTPQVVTIGPIHYGNQELREMEDHKKRYLKDFLQISKANLETCYQHIYENEKKLRDCYAHAIELDSEDFVKMVLVDAAFVLMIFLRYFFPFLSLSESIDRLYQKPKMIINIRYDLVLLENQLPFFILEDLYKLSKIHDFLMSNLNLSKGIQSYINEEDAMIVLAYKFLRNWHIIKTSERKPPSQIKHLLDLFRSCLKPEKSGDVVRKVAKNINVPSIKQLHQAGVKFQVGPKENLFDIKFSGRLLTIPYLEVNGHTELLFRNLQAFEVCHCLDKLCVDYFMMMQQFTVSSADVEFLIENKIIENRLPNAQAISTLFHNLSHGNIFDRNEFGYTDFIDKINEYYAVPWNKWKATWVQKYFKAPWAFFSFNAAILLLLLTIVQTVCSILQVT